MDKKITVDEFMAQKKAAAKSSRLDPWTDDILTLKDNGYTQKQILEFLEANGIKVSQMTLSVFIRSRQEQRNGGISTSLQEKKTANRRQKGDQKQQPDAKQKEAERIRKLNDVHVGSNKFEWPPKDVDIDDLI
ncbi:TPA: hypothetical protein ACFNMI_000025 [Neisseria bacilliformis]|jgi:hypothetical protein